MLDNSAQFRYNPSMRKKFPSDKNTTTVRVSRALHRRIKVAAKNDKRTVEGFVDVKMTAALIEAQI